MSEQEGFYDDQDFQEIDFEQSFEDAVIPTSGSNYNLELKAIYYYHGKLAEAMAMLEDDYVSFPQTSWQITGVEVKPFKELDERYSQNAFWGILDFVDQPGGAFTFIDLTAAQMVTGLSEDELAGPDGEGYVGAWLEHVGRFFREVWSEVTDFDVQAFPSPTAPSLPDLQAMFPGLNHNTPIVTTSFRVSQPGQAAVARIVLGIPQAYLLAAGNSLQAVGESVSNLNDTTHFYERLAYIEDVPVPVSVLLGKSEMTVGDLQNLEEGDIITLDTAMGLPLEVRVGSTVMRGLPGTTADGRRLAVQLQMAQPAGEYEA
jgi:hypothetical protein